MVQVEQDVRLLPGGEGEQARVCGFAGGGDGALEVGPGAGQAVHVDGLPSGQRRGVREGPSELLAVPGAQRVAAAYRFASAGQLPTKRLGRRVYVVSAKLREFIETEDEAA
jgi:hypothetical protein